LVAEAGLEPTTFGL